MNAIEPNTVEPYFDDSFREELKEKLLNNETVMARVSGTLYSYTFSDVMDEVKHHSFENVIRAIYHANSQVDLNSQHKSLKYQLEVAADRLAGIIYDGVVAYEKEC